MRARIAFQRTVDEAEAVTLISAAGLAAPQRLQGANLIPVLHGSMPERWRTSIFYQYFEYPTPHHARQHFGVVTDHDKLVQVFGTGEDAHERFGLGDDPGEMTSVLGQTQRASIQAELEVELEVELQRLRRELLIPDRFPAKAIGTIRLTDYD